MPAEFEGTAGHHGPTLSGSGPVPSPQYQPRPQLVPEGQQCREEWLSASAVSNDGSYHNQCFRHHSPDKQEQHPDGNRFESAHQPRTATAATCCEMDLGHSGCSWSHSSVPGNTNQPLKWKKCCWAFWGQQSMTHTLFSNRGMINIMVRASARGISVP